MTLPEWPAAAGFEGVSSAVSLREVRLAELGSFPLGAHGFLPSLVLCHQAP